MSTQQSEYRFDLSGRHLALNLANTISYRADPERRKERLESYRDLISFARQSELLSPQQADELRAYAASHATGARSSFGKAIVLREAIYRMFAAIADKKAPAAGDLRVINHDAREAMRHRALAPVNGGYGWEWKWDPRNSAGRILWPMALAAAELLTSDALQTVRVCEAPDCGWLFLDRSRNRSRRWCDMTSCGNREKARRHYRRRRE